MGGDGVAAPRMRRGAASRTSSHLAPEEGSRMPGDDAARVEHERHMRRALELAALGRGLVSPNPLVGAVVVRDGDVVGEGWHEGPGHAARRGPRARRGGRPGPRRHPRTARSSPAITSDGRRRARARSSTLGSLVRSSPPAIRTPWSTAGASRASGRPASRSRPASSRPCPAAERGVRTSRRDGPAVRHAEDGRVARRQDGRPRRHIAVDHRGARPRRCPHPRAARRTRSSWAPVR